MAALSFLEVARQVVLAIEAAGGACAVTGSVAGIVQGVVRATQDVDLVIELAPWRAAAFIAALGPDFDVDEPSLVEALQQERPWNIFHSPTMTRIDLFPLKDEPLANAAFRRRVSVTLEGGGRLPVLAPEDLVVQKLRWFRVGGEVSENQWRDVVGLLNANPSLDVDWLEHSARMGGVLDLLTRARAEKPLPR